MTSYGDLPNDRVEDDPDDRDDRGPTQLATVDVVGNLISAGMAPEVVALSLGLPVTQVRAIVRVTSSRLAPEEQQLQEDVRALASLAVKQAARILQFGHTEQKLRIITSMLGHAARLIGAGDGGSSNEMRQELEALFAVNRTVPVVQTVLTETEFIDISTLDGRVVDAQVTDIVRPVPPAPPPVPQPKPAPPYTPPVPIPPIFPSPPLLQPIPAEPTNTSQAMSRSQSAAALKALLESTHDKDEVSGAAEVRY